MWVCNNEARWLQKDKEGAMMRLPPIIDKKNAGEIIYVRVTKIVKSIYKWSIDGEVRIGNENWARFGAMVEDSIVKEKGGATFIKGSCFQCVVDKREDMVWNIENAIKIGELYANSD